MPGVSQGLRYESSKFATEDKFRPMRIIEAYEVIDCRKSTFSHQRKTFQAANYHGATAPILFSRRTISGMLEFVAFS